jgi:hypothetical protein
MRGVAGTAAVLFIALATMHCSSLDSAEDTFCTFHCSADPPSSSSSGVIVDAGPDGPWSCEMNGTAVSNVPAPVYPPDATPSMVTYALPIVDLHSAAVNAPSAGPLLQAGTSQPLTATILACPAESCVAPNSTMPIAVTIPPKFGGELYEITLPFQFNGGILINGSGYPMGSMGWSSMGFAGPTDSQSYIPLQYFFGGPLVGSTGPDGGPTPTVTGIAIAVPTYDWLDQLFTDVHATRDPTKAILVARVLDCNGNRAAGVTLNVTPPSNGTGFTLLTDYQAGPPVAKGSAPPATDLHGVAGYFNMDAPGSYEVTAVTPDGKAMYGVYTIAPMLQGVVTEIELRTDNQGLVGR